MIIAELQWDDDNIEQVARHGVNPIEVEDVCFGFHIRENAGNRRYVLSGQTAAGRYLNVVVERIGKDVFRPITAFEMSVDYRRRYRKRTGR